MFTYLSHCLKNMMEQGKKLWELSSSIPSIKNAISKNTQDITELSVHMIYIFCDYTGAALDDTA